MQEFLSFDACWDTPLLALDALDVPGHSVVKDRVARVSELGAPEVIVVLPGARLVVDVAAPQVRFLVLYHGDVQGRLSAFEGLESLAIWSHAMYSGRLDGPFGLGLEVDMVPRGLADVIGPGLLAEQLSARSLRRVRLSGLTDAGSFSAPDMVWLDMAPRRGVAACLRPMVHLERLQLSLEAASMARLSVLGEKPRLVEASFLGGGLRSLDGVQAWGALRRLLVHTSAIQTLEPLVETALEQLEIVAPRNELDLSPLSRNAHTRELDLRLFQHVDTLGADWSGARRLETVTLGECQLTPRALDGLALAPGLKRLSTHTANRVAAARLREARPDVQVVLSDEPVQVAPRPFRTRIEPVDHGWSIFQDLAAPLRLSSNHEVEARVLAGLDDHTRDLVEFDTEAGAFSAHAESRAAIEAVAAIIERLHRDEHA